MLLFECFEALAEFFEAWVAESVSEPAGDRDLDLFGLLFGVWGAEDGFEEIGVEYQRFEIVADLVDVDVLVDQRNGLGAEGMSDQPTVTRRRFHRLVDLRQPPVVGFISAECRVRRDRLPEP